MPSPTNNPPYAVLELSQDEYELLLATCEANITFGLLNLQTVEDRPTAERLVGLLEGYKGLKNKLTGSMS